MRNTECRKEVVGGGVPRDFDGSPLCHSVYRSYLPGWSGSGGSGCNEPSKSSRYVAFFYICRKSLRTNVGEMPLALFNVPALKSSHPYPHASAHDHVRLYLRPVFDLDHEATAHWVLSSPVSLLA